MVQMIMEHRMHAVAEAALTHAIEALKATRRGLSPEMVMDAVRLIASHHAGAVVTTGVGKSALVAQRIAATLRVVGVRAWFLHPTEAPHGDVGGMNTAEDVLLVCSRSGESKELQDLLEYAKEWAVPVIAITSASESMLTRVAKAVLLHSGKEACPFGLTPTSSVTAAGALGDALGMALQTYLGFSVEDFHRLHKDGILGRRLTLKVADVMVKWVDVGHVAATSNLYEALIALAKYRGTVLVYAQKRGEGELLGVVTAGDVARCCEEAGEEAEYRMNCWKVGQIMTRQPKWILPDVLVVDAIERMQQAGIMALPVLGAGAVPLGMIHLHDALRARVQ